MPAVDNINLWFGTLFVHKGYYRNAVFKFQLVIPPEYPERRPTVHFLSDLFHPLIDQHGQLALQYQFPQWRPHRDYLFHVLHYVKAIFKKCVLDTVVEKQAVNKEAYRMYRNENTIFAKLAQQRAQLSITDSNLYDNYPANNSIKFGPLGDQEFGEFLHLELI
ncbi:MAG: ubiquitin-conjugating enzyme/RWD-like protein [Podila humilis]|nr:MAG: ubiquitin-conjugating enzyme/RWD-like protein [Podila humilis]